MNIEENNKLIAEFMEIEMFGEGKDHTEALLICSSLDLSVNPCTHFENVQETVHLDDMKFDSSWDWLMPVVKHCTDLTRNFEFCSEQYLYWQNELFHPDYMLSEFIENDISSIYSRVVEFIKWYNETAKTD